MTAGEIERKLTTILVADVVGFSRLAAADEERTLARLRALRSDLIDPAIALHHGRVVKRTGDGFVVEFRSVVDTVRCAIEVQSAMAERNAGLSPDRRIEFRVGVHLGDVVEEADGDLMGDGVNVAARLESICEPGGICLSDDACARCVRSCANSFVDLGEKQLKNIARPVRAYALPAARLAAFRPSGGAEGEKARRPGGAGDRSRRRASCRGPSRRARTVGARGWRRAPWAYRSRTSSPTRRACRSSCCRSRI